MGLVAGAVVALQVPKVRVAPEPETPESRAELNAGIEAYSANWKDVDAGDINLTFKRYLESRIRLTIQNDYITDIAGEGLDAALTDVPDGATVMIHGFGNAGMPSALIDALIATGASGQPVTVAA